MKADCYRPSDEVAHDPGSPNSAINLVIIYEDSLTREWGRQVCNLVTDFVEKDCVASNSWRVCDLAAPQILHDAVRAAAQADVIVLSLRDAEELPLNLRDWIEAWLPRRELPVGALITLIGVADESKASSLHARRQLEAVARRARMDLLLEERRPPSLSPQSADSEWDYGPANILLSNCGSSSIRESGPHEPGGNQRIMTRLNP
jgi:hypothetical protein